MLANRQSRTTAPEKKKTNGKRIAEKERTKTFKQSKTVREENRKR